MPIEDLRPTAQIDEEIDTGPDKNVPVEAPALVPTLFPADPAYCITVFYDPEVITDDPSYHELNARMTQTYAGRTIYMKETRKTSIEYRRLSKFPENESRFLRRGYVADVEGRIFRVGWPAKSSYAKRNVRSLYVNIMLMEAFLREQPIGGINRQLDAQASWRNVWATMGPVTGEKTQHQDEREGIIIARMEEDVNAEFDIASKVYPLVEHQGLLLGCTNFRTARAIHWTYDVTPLTAWYEGDKESVCGALFGRKAKDVRKQIAFEANNARFIFRPELLKIGARRSEVTPLMIATWYSQAIASIRKICWFVVADEDSSVAAHELRQEEALHGFALGSEERLPISGRSWDQFMLAKSRDLNAVMASHNPHVAQEQTTTHAISWDDEILGALMGTTYHSHNDPEESPYSNPAIFTVSLARWIGRLKRRGLEKLDWWIADSILSFWYRSRHETLLLSQFSEATWECLVLSAKELEYDDDGREFHVTYEWTRDRAAPFKCHVQNNTIMLEGPLLFFPTLQSNHWRRMAQVVNRLGGFEVR